MTMMDDDGDDDDDEEIQQHTVIYAVHDDVFAWFDASG